MILGIMLVLSIVAVSAQMSDSRIRVLHASPDAPPVDIWVDGNVAISDVELGEVTDYAMLPFGRYDIGVTPTGAADPVVIDAELDLGPVRDYTVVAVDYLDSIMPLVLEDKRFMVPRNRALVRFVHASPSVDPVDIVISGGPTLFTDVEFSQATPYAWVPGGSYDVEVQVAGMTALTVPVTLENGHAYTAFALEDGGVTPLLVEDRVNPSLR